MDKTVHIKGFGKDIKILDELSDNYDIPNSGFDMEYDSSEPEIIDNCLVQIWHSDKECSLNKAIEGHLRTVLGQLYLEGNEYGYSEYTIMGFNVTEAKIGGHDLQTIIDNYPDEYLHILITEVDKES